MGSSGTLILLAAEKSAPLIDIDGTVFIQFGIFLVMMAILYAFVFRPYLKVRDQREAGIGGARGEAKAAEERAGALGADYEAKLLKAKQRGAEERGKVRAEAAAHERDVLGRARDEAQKEIAKVREAAAAQEQRARATLLADAPTVGKSIASRLLGRPL